MQYHGKRAAKIIEDGVGGLIVLPKDPQALAEAVEWLLNNPEERQRMGEAGWRLVHERFDLRVTSAQLAAIYRELAEQACKKQKSFREAARRLQRPSQRIHNGGQNLADAAVSNYSVGLVSSSERPV